MLPFLLVVSLLVGFAQIVYISASWCQLVVSINAAQSTSCIIVYQLGSESFEATGD